MNEQGRDRHRRRETRTAIEYIAIDATFDRRECLVQNEVGIKDLDLVVAELEDSAQRSQPHRACEDRRPSRHPVTRDESHLLKLLIIRLYGTVTRTHLGSAASDRGGHHRVEPRRTLREPVVSTVTFLSSSGRSRDASMKTIFRGQSMARPEVIACTTTHNCEPTPRNPRFPNGTLVAMADSRRLRDTEHVFVEVRSAIASLRRIYVRGVVARRFQFCDSAHRWRPARLNRTHRSAHPARATGYLLMGKGETSNGTARIAELDGIRAIAILAVLASHVVEWGYPYDPSKLGSTPHWLIPAVRLSLQGWLGVDLFFVLSGFLITGILLGTRTQASYFRNFYTRRALRILPVFLIALALMVAWYRSDGPYFLLALGFASDLAPLFRVDAPVGATALWSLAVEEQFYLLWPVLVLFLCRRRLALVAVAVVIAVPLARLATPEESYFLPWLRCDGLALGALLAIWVRRDDVSVHASIRLALGGAFLAGLLVVVDRWLLPSTRWGALRITEADLLFAGMILIAFTLRGSRLMAVLRSRPARFIAATSYCAYIIHGPIFDAIGIAARTTAQQSSLGMVLRAGFGLPLTFALAALSWRYLESPILRLKTDLATQFTRKTV